MKMRNPCTLSNVDTQPTKPKQPRILMYQLQYDDLYDAQYDVWDNSKECRYADASIISLIEELYSSKTLNKQAIADSLSALVMEITPEEEYMFYTKNITLKYTDNFSDSLAAWLDALNPTTGELDYMRLANGACGQPKKQLVQFDDIFSAVNALTFQLTTRVPFDDNVLAGALVFLANKYGVSAEDAELYQPNAERN